ncbi:cupin [Virgibacillus salexigens]|uniref:cupin n=1 Tax=Virgibacillus salexigens TaxID=61016 RepID=UPI00190ADFE9|nr:cupin [Virgibacillus salexigens]
MKIFNFAKDAGNAITLFGSINMVMSRIIQIGKGRYPYWMYSHLEANGKIGEHAASTDQLLLIVSGSGQVKGKENVFQDVTRNDAVLWERTEMHKTITETGLTAIVIEGNSIDPAPYLPMKQGHSY